MYFSDDLVTEACRRDATLPYCNGERRRAPPEDQKSPSNPFGEEDTNSQEAEENFKDELLPEKEEVNFFFPFFVLFFRSNVK